MPQALRRVVVTGLGCVSPLGVGVQRTWQRLLAGDSGIVSVADRAPQDRWAQLPSTVAGVVPEGAGGVAAGLWRADDWVNAAEQRRMARFAQFAVAATDMALAQAGWLGRAADAAATDAAATDTAGTDAEAVAACPPYAAEDSPQARTGVCIGSGIGNLEQLYDASVAHAAGGYRRVSPLLVPRLLINMAAGHVAQRFGLQGPNHAATTACTTGAHSIGDAARFVALGDADVMVAGGAEACVHPLALAGFGRSRSLAPAPAGSGSGSGSGTAPAAACRPFDRDRAGFVVAEGAAVLVLEARDHARARGAPILAELRGYGCSGDAFHMTAPRPDGAGPLRAMRRALHTAGLRPRDVDYINAHATGTVLGDAAEAAALRALMHADGVTCDADVTVSSTKGAVGHLLGAAGALEALFCVLAIAENVAPPTRNLRHPDVGPAFNFVANDAQPRKIDVAMTNSFGFGGTNASLVFARPD